MMTYLSHPPICCIRLMRPCIAPLGPLSLRNKWLRSLLLLQFHRNVCLLDSRDEDKTSKMHKPCFNKERKLLRSLGGRYNLCDGPTEEETASRRSFLPGVKQRNDFDWTDSGETFTKSMIVSLDMSPPPDLCCRARKTTHQHLSLQGFIIWTPWTCLHFWDSTFFKDAKTFNDESRSV